MAITGEAYGGSMLVTGWTNQNLGETVGGSTVSPNLEVGAGPGFLDNSSPTQNGYLGWSLIPEDAISATSNHGSASTSTAFLTRIPVVQGGYCTHIDMAVCAGTVTTVTGSAFALYNAASFATGPLAWTADTATAGYTASTNASLTWGGASSPSSVYLQAGTTYWIFSTTTLGSGGVLNLAASVGGSAGSMNLNQTASATNGANAMIYTSAPSGLQFASVVSGLTLTPQTTWALSATKFFFALR